MRPPVGDVRLPVQPGDVVVTVPNGTSAPGLEGFTDSRFPQLVQRNKLFFEG